MSIPNTSTSHMPLQEQDVIHQPSFSSLPHDVLLNCLARVPRRYDLNVSCVSKTLRSLVRSPDLYRLRALLHKESLYVLPSHRLWFRLCPTEKTTTTTDYNLVQIPFPSHGFMLYSSTVVVGSEIYFIGGRHHRFKDLWILDTKSGQLREGPSMQVARYGRVAAVGVVDDKIYVIGRSKKQVQVEVFDPKSQSWEFATKEKVRCEARFSASSEGKIYVVDDWKIWVYNPREGLSKEILTRKKRIRNRRLDRSNGELKCVCAVKNVLYAFFDRSGLMWFDTKLNKWRRLVTLPYTFTQCLLVSDWSAHMILRVRYT